MRGPRPRQGTARDADEGRFLVELSVAPALPLEFVTIQLVQSNTRTLVTERS